MIVRIMGEGQFDVPEDALDRLNELDSAVESAVANQDHDGFRAALADLLDGIRAVATQHPDDALDESDIIVPPADATLEQVRELLNDDGLIPG